MKKVKVVIASVLKPVDETRMFEKISISLAQTNKYAINIIGFSSKKKSEYENITFYPVFRFKRISWGRVAAPWKYFRLLVKISPGIILFGTHELIIPTLLYRFFYGAKIVYDVQENHYRNILHTGTFPKGIRWAIAAWVRAKETLSRPGVDLFLLAEKNYEKEFRFSVGKSVVIENKYKAGAGSPAPPERGRSRLLFSGTLAPTTGVFEAIKLAKDLHRHEPGISLSIIGHCAQSSVLEQIKTAVEKHPYISLTGGPEPVPYDEIRKAIEQSDFGIIYYPTNKSTINSTPTKLYEYLANALPILLQEHPTWLQICQQYQACIPIDIRKTEAPALLKKMHQQTFYPKGKNSNELNWTSEEKKLISAINKIL